MDDKIRAALRGDPDAAAACTAGGVAINCPCCVGEAAVWPRKDGVEMGVVCKQCYLSTPWMLGNAALAAWNRRVRMEDLKMKCVNCPWMKSLTDSEDNVIDFCMNTDGGNYLGETGVCGFCDWEGADNET